MKMTSILRRLISPGAWPHQTKHRLAPGHGLARRRGLCFGLALGLSAVMPVRAQVSPEGSPVELWQGTLRVEAQQGKACAETSSGQALPYSKDIRIRLQTDARGRTQGLAWGDMLPTRLSTLVIPAATRQGGPADAEVVGPPDLLVLSWLPAKGSLSPGQLSRMAHLKFERQGDVLTGRWRERMDDSAALDDQCLWSEASLRLTRVADAQAQQFADESRRLQASLELMEAQAALPVAERWSPAAVKELVKLQEGVDVKGQAARTLMPLMAKLAEQVALNQSGAMARPLLQLAVQWIEAQLEQRPLEMAPFVTHMTPTLRAGAMLAEAEMLNRKTVATLVDKGFGKSSELARLLSGYGAVLLRMKSNEQALQVYEQALVIERSIKGGKHVGLVIGLVNLSRVCETLGQTERARQLADEASEVHESLGLGPLKTGPATRGGARAI